MQCLVNKNERGITLEYCNLIVILLEEFPELLQTYEEEKEYLEDLPHLVFEDIFVPYLIGLVEKPNEEDKINKACVLIENMIICPEEKIQEVAVVSVLEALLPHRNVIEKIKVDFGENTIGYLNKLEKAYGWKT